jgi:NADH dehydrogenase FAD-containing subunit
VSHGKYVAKQLKRLAAGQLAVPYHPHNPISVVPVGEGWAVANYQKFVLTGWLASLLRRAADLIGYVDVASIPVALTLWLADHKIENECPLCRRRGH